MAKLRILRAVAASVDGTAAVRFDIVAVAADGLPIGSRHVNNLSVPQAELADALAMPDGTPQEKQAKNIAIKDIIAAHLPRGWENTELEENAAGNAASQEVAGAFNEYVTDTLSQSYPLDFNLEL